jgi:hypothetical protein
LCIQFVLLGIDHAAAGIFDELDVTTREPALSMEQVSLFENVIRSLLIRGDCTLVSSTS